MECSAPLEPKVLDVSFAQKTVICLTRLASLSGDTDQDVVSQYSGDHVTVLKVDKLAKVRKNCLLHGKATSFKYEHFPITDYLCVNHCGLARALLRNLPVRECSDVLLSDAQRKAAC